MNELINFGSRRLLYVDNVSGIFDLNEKVVGEKTQANGVISVIENGPKTIINLLDWYDKDNLEKNEGIELRDSLGWAPCVMGLEAPREHYWFLSECTNIVDKENDEITIVVKIKKAG
jgi:hypothetical protein